MEILAEPFRLAYEYINVWQLKVFGGNFRLREIGRIVPLKYAILSFGKCLNYQISGFQKGDFF